MPTYVTRALADSVHQSEEFRRGVRWLANLVLEAELFPPDNPPGSYMRSDEQGRIEWLQSDGHVLKLTPTSARRYAVMLEHMAKAADEKVVRLIADVQAVTVE